MLPFLKHKDRQAPGIVQQFRTKSGLESEPSSEGLDGAEVCAREIISAIESKDHKKLADALSSIFQIFDSLPHHEGPHED